MSGEKKDHLQNVGVTGTTLVMKFPSPLMAGKPYSILNRLPTTWKMKGDTYHRSCLLHFYLNTSKLLTKDTKNLQHFLVGKKF